MPHRPPPYSGHHFPREVIAHAVRLAFRSARSFRGALLALAAQRGRCHVGAVTLSFAQALEATGWGLRPQTLPSGAGSRTVHDGYRRASNARLSR